MMEAAPFCQATVTYTIPIRLGYSLGDLAVSVPGWATSTFTALPLTQDTCASERATQ